jgi:hypothetical protein
MINPPGRMHPTSRDVGHRPPLRTSPGDRVRTRADPETQNRAAQRPPHPQPLKNLAPRMHILLETPNRVAQLQRRLQLWRSHAPGKQNRGWKRRGRSRRSSRLGIGTKTRIRPAANPHRPRILGSQSCVAGSLPDRSKPEITLVRTAVAGPRPYFLPQNRSLQPARNLDAS